MLRPHDLTDDDAWQMFQACQNGDLPAVQTLIARRPELAVVEYNYTPPLHFAVREGHAEIVKLLTAQGADAVTYRSYPFLETLLAFAQDRGYTEIAAHLTTLVAQHFPVTESIAGFLQAAREGDLPAVQAQLAANPALAAAQNDTGDTALHQAVANGHQSVVDTLLDAGAPIDAQRADGVRPIHCALRRHPDLAAHLLNCGAARNIYIATAMGDTDAVRHALAQDPSLANFQDTHGHRPISAAAARDDLKTIQLLLEHGANPSLPEHGAPLGLALWLAVYYQRVEMAQLLLEHGANPNTNPESSGPALLHARKHPGLKRLLLQYGAQAETSPAKRFHTLVSDNELARVARWLKKFGPPSNPEKQSWGEGILAGPANSNNREMVELLMRYGATVPPISKWGPEYYGKHPEMLRFLLERGMNPNHHNWHHVTMLHHMAAKGLTEKARILVDHGANVNALDEEYRSTPLGFAARWGHADIVQLLLERGADPNLAAAPWATPLAWAKAKGHTAIAATLRAAGAKDWDRIAGS